MAGVVPAVGGTEETRATTLRAQAGAEDICETHEARMAIRASILGSSDEAGARGLREALRYPPYPLPSTFIHGRSAMRNPERGAVGWVLLWLIGIPIPILLVLFLIRGCT
jgi:hypothetical protein